MVQIISLKVTVAPRTSPVCLRKLEWSIGFDVVERYAFVERITREAKFMDEAEWLRRQLKRLTDE
jgi:hypothetical protein